MNVLRAFFALITLVLIGGPQANAIVVIDGSLTGDGYGAPLAVQTVQTGFGDDIDNTNTVKGSELDAAYAQVGGGVLNIMLTGNLEDNFNKVVLFFDSVPGGVNSIDGFANPIVDPSPFPSDPGMLQKLDGFTFDAGFNADYVMVLRHGFTGSENRFDLDFASVGPAGVSSQYLGVFLPVFSTDWSGSGTTGTGAANAAPISVGFDNSNVLGIEAGTGAANQTAAAAVATGVEIGLPLSVIGSPTGDIKIMAYITSSNHDYFSNQFLGGLPPSIDNLGSLPPDLALEFAGNQYFVVSVPEASGALLTGVVMLMVCIGFWKRK